MTRAREGPQAPLQTVVPAPENRFELPLTRLFIDGALTCRGCWFRITGTDHVGDPVDVPTPAAICGERLLETGGGRSDPGPNIAHQNIPAIRIVLRMELTLPMGELAHLCAR